MVPLATHRLNFSRKTISTKTDIYITHTKDTGRVLVHYHYNLCRAFRLWGRRKEMWAGKTARGWGWCERSLTSRRTTPSKRLEQATITLKYVAVVDPDLKGREGGGTFSSLNEKSRRLGFTGLGFGVKVRGRGGATPLPPPPPPPPPRAATALCLKKEILGNI